MTTRIAPESVTLASLCNADENATNNIDRRRYVINPVPEAAATEATSKRVESYGWNRCAGGSVEH